MCLWTWENYKKIQNIKYKIQKYIIISDFNNGPNFEPQTKGTDNELKWGKKFQFSNVCLGGCMITSKD